MRRLVIAVFVLGGASTAWALDIPLSVPERAGVERIDNQVYGGVPLPEGAYKDVDKFSLVDAAGKPVPAQFVIRERWLKDDSVRFATVHFKTDLKANDKALFTVKDSGGPVAPPAPASVTEAVDGVTVDTGTVKFTVKKGDWHLFDSVDAGGKPALKGPGKVVYKAEYGTTAVVAGDAPNKIKLVPLGTPADATAVIKSVAVEEKGPGRVVVLVKGAFQQDGANKLDFQARYYAIAGCSTVRVVFTVINRQGKAFNEFVGLRALGFELPLAGPLDGERKFVLGASEGKDVEGTLAAADKVVQLQPNSLEYVVSGKADARGKCREPRTQRVGWMSLAGKDMAVTAAVRWFWQLHPKGLEAAGDGTLKVWLVPWQEKKVEVPAGEYTESQVRIDLYTGGAKTHDLVFAFHPAAGAADARSRAMSAVAPLFAACQPEWYCQKTLAFDKICDVRLENYPAELREMIQGYENCTDKSFATFMAYMDGKEKKDVKFVSCLPIILKDKDGKVEDTTYVSSQKLEEFGWLNFGSHIDHKDYVVENSALDSMWDGNYYDVPRACLIRFVRSGMWQYFDQAEEAGMHLADIDICHWQPQDQRFNGEEHFCPTVGHFRGYGQALPPFTCSGNVDSCKSQSLYELYNLTGDGWYREVGLLSGSYLTVHGGSALRAKGNRITGLFMAYRSSHDEKYRKVWEQQAKETTAFGIERGGTRAWGQFWMYGLATEGLYNYFHATGDLNAAKACVFAAESLQYCDVNKTMGKSQRAEFNGLAGFSVPAIGYAYELTGDGTFVKYGLERLKVMSGLATVRSKPFAQSFRISPQFLYYLSNDYRAPKPVVGEKQVADPVEPVLKAFAAGPPTTNKN